jgi:hypothetical protein
MYTALSWGCGVQSTAIVEMALDGIFEIPDLVIHSDTGWERRATEEIREFYSDRWVKLGINVEVVHGGDIRAEGAADHIHIPFFTSNGGPLRRQCTRHFKIMPMRRRIRELIGFYASSPPHPPEGSVEQWLGISWDEWQRVRHSDVKFIVNRWPLIEKRITRNDCVDFLESHVLPVPAKSACVCCPYRSASEWLEMRDTAPLEFDDAVAFDEANRHNPLSDGGGSTSEELYIYRRGPLSSAKLMEHASGERRGKQLPLVVCESGHCFV